MAVENQTWGAWLVGQDTDTDGDGDVDYSDYLLESQRELIGLVATDEDGDGDYLDEETEWVAEEVSDAADYAQDAGKDAAKGLNWLGLAAVGGVGLAWWQFGGLKSGAAKLPKLLKR